jgi:hypothetical protein
MVQVANYPYFLCFDDLSYTIPLPYHIFLTKHDPYVFPDDGCVYQPKHFEINFT